MRRTTACDLKIRAANTKLGQESGGVYELYVGDARGRTEGREEFCPSRKIPPPPPQPGLQTNPFKTACRVLFRKLLLIPSRKLRCLGLTRVLNKNDLLSYPCEFFFFFLKKNELKKEKSAHENISRLSRRGEKGEVPTIHPCKHHNPCNTDFD